MVRPSFFIQQQSACSQGTIPEVTEGQGNRVTMFATGKVTNERWTCAEEGFVLVTTTNLSATLHNREVTEGQARCYILFFSDYSQVGYFFRNIFCDLKMNL